MRVSLAAAQAVVVISLSQTYMHEQKDSEAEKNQFIDRQLLTRISSIADVYVCGFKFQANQIFASSGFFSFATFTASLPSGPNTHVVCALHSSPSNLSIQNVSREIETGSKGVRLTNLLHKSPRSFQLKHRPNGSIFEWSRMNQNLVFVAFSTA